MPKVSVVIPTHNRPDLLKKALKSVLEQSFSDYEVLVVDDGLALRAEEVIRELNDPRIKYLQHEREKGGAAARNTGIKAASSALVAFLDDDDEWLPAKLALQVEIMETVGPEVGFCFSAVIKDVDSGEYVVDVPTGLVDYYEVALRHFKGILTSALVVRRSALSVVGLFAEDLPSHQDAELIIRLSEKFKAFGLEQPLVRMFSHGGHEHIGGNPTNKIRGLEKVLDKHQQEYQKRPKVLARHLFRLSILYRDSDNRSQARSYLKRALVYDFKPRYLFHYLRLFW